MVVEVKWTLYSLEDIDSIANFIAKDSEHFASIQVEKFFIRSEILENYSNTGGTVAEFGDANIRELIEGCYRIIYRVLNESRIDILAVHHSNRLLSNNPLFET